MRTDWAAASVTQANNKKVTITSVNGIVVEADVVIVAVPVAVLQKRVIEFHPPLPPGKWSAIDSIRVEAACKVLLTFDSPPWAAAALAKRPLHSIICAECEVPELWFKQKRTGEWIVSGFATGELAASLCARPTDKAVEALLQQLAEVLPHVFAAEGSNTAQPELLARLRASLIDAHVVDWAAEPWALGGYSCPAFGEAAEARSVYRASCELLCFCGEATEDSCMTMSAAIESGRRAASEAVRAVGLGG